MSEPATSPQIAVVIATRDRAELLSQRALASVAAQTRRPEHVVVVDDSSPEFRPRNGDLVASVHLPGSRITYLENARTQGASGSWNTAVDFLFGTVNDPEHLFVAIVDDDDAWAPTYLEKCYATACDHKLDMVAADLRRIESAGGAPLILINEAPTSLRAGDFLTGNPGVQGSNLFLRLSVLLAAGGFDEGLRSTTDRDLCIRIADLGTVRYGRLALALVDHFADSGRARLSTRGSAAKLDGLTAFWQKYAGRMTPGERRAFCDRAAALFDWVPPSTHGVNRVSMHVGGTSAAGSQAPKHEPFTLYVGVISSDPVMLRPLLDGLTSLRSSPGIKRLAAVVLDNGSPAPELQEVIGDARRAGLPVALVPESQQRRDAASGAFGAPFRDRPGGQVGIAQARTMLQRYVGALLCTDQGSLGWLLDDDMRVDDRAFVYLPWLPAFRESGVDVLIGHYEGSSPNPWLNGLRVHLVDLLHNLLWLQRLPPDAVLPDRTAENAALRAEYPDYYYDLSRKHTGHLEMPHWQEPVVRGETAGQAYSRLLSGALGILSGDPPLTLQSRIFTATPSLMRQSTGAGRRTDECSERHLCGGERGRSAHA